MITDKPLFQMIVYIAYHGLWLLLDFSMTHWWDLTPFLQLVLTSTQTVCVFLTLSLHFSFFKNDGIWHWLLPDALYPMLFGNDTAQLSDLSLYCLLGICSVLIVSLITSVHILSGFAYLTSTLLMIGRCWIGLDLAVRSLDYCVFHPLSSAILVHKKTSYDEDSVARNDRKCNPDADQSPRRAAA